MNEIGPVTPTATHMCMPRLYLYKQKILAICNRTSFRFRWAWVCGWANHECRSDPTLPILLYFQSNAKDLEFLYIFLVIIYKTLKIIQFELNFHCKRNSTIFLNKRNCKRENSQILLASKPFLSILNIHHYASAYIWYISQRFSWILKYWKKLNDYVWLFGEEEFLDNDYVIILYKYI